MYFRHIKKSDDFHVRNLTHFGHGIFMEMGSYPARGNEWSSKFEAHLADPEEEIEFE